MKDKNATSVVRLSTSILTVSRFTKPLIANARCLGLTIVGKVLGGYLGACVFLQVNRFLYFLFIIFSQNKNFIVELNE